MSRRYTVEWVGDIASADGNVDLLELVPATDKPVKLVGFKMGQISDVGDAQEEILDILVQRMDASFSSGSGGVTTNTNPRDPNDAAAGFTAEGRNTTVATATNSKVLDRIPWNVRNGPLEVYYPDPDFRPRFHAAFNMAIRLDAAVVDTISVRFAAEVEEV